MSMYFFFLYYNYNYLVRSRFCVILRIVVSILGLRSSASVMQFTPTLSQHFFTFIHFLYLMVEI